MISIKFCYFLRERGSLQLAFGLALIIFFSLTSYALAQETTNKQHLTFDNFLREVRDSNLVLKIEVAKLAVAKANAIGLRIPAPTFGYKRRTDQSGSFASGVELAQKIPFPNKIFNDYQARKYEFGAQKEASLGVESEIFARARLVYFSLWASLKFKEILNEKKEVIKHHIKLTQAIVRSDSFLKVHLIKAQMDLDFLDNELSAAKQDIKEKTVLMAEFLNIDPLSFNPSLEEPEKISIPAKKGLQNPHQLEAKRLTFESFKKREKEANSAWFPDIYLRYSKLNKTQMIQGHSETTIGVSVPFIFPWEPYSISQKGLASKNQAGAEYKRDKTRIAAEIIILFDKLESFGRQLDNINQRLLPLAKKRLSTIRNLAPRDLSTLQEYRETKESFPDLKFEALRIRTKYEETLFELLKYEQETK
jgi:outer membrane protein TolC